MHRRGLSSWRASSTHTLKPLPKSIRSLLQRKAESPILGEHTKGSDVTVNGWVRSIRRQKAVAFITLNDGSSVESIQVVAPREATQELSLGTSVSCVGSLQPSPGPNQPLELQATRIDVLGESSNTYPIQKKAQPAEFLRKYPHLRSRTAQGVAMLRFRDKAVRAIHDAYQQEEFILVHPPILTSNDCEGAGEAFRISTDALLSSALQPSSALSLKTPSPSASPPSIPRMPEFFDKPTYLTVSTQLHLEALASSLSRVYTISPVFRAEPSQTHRHVSEFSMLEAEMSFVNNLEDVMSFAERSLKNTINTLVETAKEEIGVFQDMQDRYGGHPTEAVIQGQALASSFTPMNLLNLHASISSSSQTWARMTYTQAVAELESHVSSSPEAFQYPVGYGLPLQSEHEKWLAGTLVNGPVFVTDYPATHKPFYMRQNPPDDDKGQDTVACFDLLVPHVGELIGGSLREERLPNLLHAMTTQNVPQNGMEWYLDLRTYGSTPHGGFGLGFERLVSWLTGFENVRDCMPFPRAAGKILL